MSWCVKDDHSSWTVPFLSWTSGSEPPWSWPCRRFAPGISFHLHKWQLCILLNRWATDAVTKTKLQYQSLSRKEGGESSTKSCWLELQVQTKDMFFKNNFQSVDDAKESILRCIRTDFTHSWCVSGMSRWQQIPGPTQHTLEGPHHPSGTGTSRSSQKS